MRRTSRNPTPFYGSCPRRAASRGKKEFTARGPELVVEVSYSSRGRDTGPKFKLYQHAGVLEYINLLVREQRVTWHELVDGAYREVHAGTDGVFQSRVFPGLWLHEGALWRRDSAGMIGTLQRGLDTPEHARFVRSLGTA